MTRKNVLATLIKGYAMKDLIFPKWTYTKTDQQGNVETFTTRQKTIDGVIWSDATIEYYEAMNKIIDKVQLDESINELTKTELVAESTI